MEVYQFIKPLGIATYSMIFITILSGLFRKSFPYKKWIKFHLIFAITSLTLATIHVLIIITSHSH